MKFNYYSMLAGVLLMASCDKEILTEAPAFDVTTETTTYKAGQEIKFDIKGGDAQMISFYSGETLNDYTSKDGRVIDVKGAGATMAFTSSVQVGTQANQLTLLYSTNFNGDYSTLAKVKAATWTDITSKFKLGTGTAFLASGTVDISDLMVAGKSIYFAFKYITKPQVANGFARSWYIQTFAVTSKAKLDNTISLFLADQASAGFRIVDDNAATAPARSTITATRLTLYGNVYKDPADPLYNSANPIFDPLNPIYDPTSSTYSPTAVRPVFVAYDPANPYNDPLSEHWAVSSAIKSDNVDLGPDWSTSLKGIRNPIMVEYRYTYATPGTYKAVFVASNASIDGEKKVVKEITLTITP